jgi:hypothetical protein
MLSVALAEVSRQPFRETTCIENIFLEQSHGFHNEGRMRTKTHDV